MPECPILVFEQRNERGYRCFGLGAEQLDAVAARITLTPAVVKLAGSSASFLADSAGWSDRRCRFAASMWTRYGTALVPNARTALAPGPALDESALRGPVIFQSSSSHTVSGLPSKTGSGGTVCGSLGSAFCRRRTPTSPRSLSSSRNCSSGSLSLSPFASTS